MNIWGFGFTHFFEVRFEAGVNVTAAVVDFLTWSNDYYLIPVAPERAIYKFEANKLPELMESESLNQDDYLITDWRYPYVLVKNRHRKLIGVGDFIRKRMKQQVGMQFAGSPIMFTTSDDLSE